MGKADLQKSIWMIASDREVDMDDELLGAMFVKEDTKDLSGAYIFNIEKQL